jgi:hypothetical protein
MLDRIYIQRLYADHVGSRLSGFKVQSYSPYRANFRCPICGDSQTNKSKKRAYFIQRDSNLMFYCHNECGTIGFERFMRDNYGDLYTAYKFELIKLLREERSDSYVAPPAPPAAAVEAPVVFTVKKAVGTDLMQSSDNEAAMKYLNNRKIPLECIPDIFFSYRFKRFINSYLPDKFPEEQADREDPRIVLPMRWYDGTVFGVIGRSVIPESQLRYMTIKFDETKPKFFGLDRLNSDKLAYVTEGPIDSLFIDNAIAMAGTDSNPDAIFRSKDDYVVVLDNQPRSSSVIYKYTKYLNQGCKLVIWPSSVPYKDINDCITKGGMSVAEVNSIIRENTYSGLKAKIVLNEWKRA